ncbi:hypothetical protein Agub_g5181, partial [Astrephomene gubernaculifera]
MTMPLVFRASRHPEGEGISDDKSTTGTAIGFGAGVAAAAAFAYAVHKAARLRSSVGTSQWKLHVAQDGTVPDFDDLLQHIADKGLDPEVRPEIWPLLLGVYDPGEGTEQRTISYGELRQRYDALLQQCQDMETACLGHIAMRRSTARVESCGSGGADSTTIAASGPASAELHSASCEVASAASVEVENHDDRLSLRTPVSGSRSQSRSCSRNNSTNGSSSGDATAEPGRVSSAEPTAITNAAGVDSACVGSPENGASGRGGSCADALTPPCFGRLSRTDVPPSLRPYFEAQQSIAMDIIRTDFKKANLPGSAISASCTTGSGSGGGGLASSLRTLSLSIRACSDGGGAGGSGG